MGLRALRFWTAFSPLSFDVRLWSLVSRARTGIGGTGSCLGHWFFALALVTYYLVVHLYGHEPHA